MDQLVLSLLSIVIGVIATLLVSHYYFRRSVNKSLTPYVQFTSSLFRGVDPSVREALKIEYKGTPVDELYEIQFLIANTGERALRDIISPLTLAIPVGCTLLDAALLHVSPEGRNINIKSNDQSVIFDFPLLNSKEFFIAKLLLKGSPKFKDFQFKITVDDIPPVISPQMLPYDLIAGSEKREFELPLLIIGFLLFIFGIPIGILVYNSWSTVDSLWSAGFWQFIKNQSITSISILLASIPSLALIVVGVMMMVGSAIDFRFPPKHKFVVPDDIIKRRYPMLPLDLEGQLDDVEKIKNDLKP